MALLWVWIPSINIASKLHAHGEINRYLILLPFLVVIGTVFLVRKIKAKRQILLVLGALVALLGFRIGIAARAIQVSEAAPNSENYALIELLSEEKLYKGYAANRNAGINTFLSDQAITIYPLICHENELTVRDIFFDTARLFISAKRTFYLYEPDNFRKPGCSIDVVAEQLGEPTEVISELPLENALLLIYNYDIVSRMELRK